MKKLFLLILSLFITGIIKAQIDAPGDLAAIGLGATLSDPNYKFTYQNKSVAHYGLGWYSDSQFTGGPMGYLSGYGGIKFFTAGAPKLILNNAGFLGLGTLNPIVRLDVSGREKIFHTLGTNDYTNVAQHQGQLRIENGLGSLQSRALEFALLDNGTAVIQANEAGVGYNTLALNPTSGNVGIGTTTPSFKLQVEGNLKVFTPNSSILIDNVSSGENYYSASSFHSFQIAGNEKFRIANNGNIGIGTPSPDEKLTVKGKIHAEEIKVDLSVPGPDYVFEKKYDLKPLSEIQKYIQENKHLPEVPSAKQMETNGINLSEMNMLLLKKIEELTLHLIEQQKQIENQAKDIAMLKLK